MNSSVNVFLLFRIGFFQHTNDCCQNSYTTFLKRGFDMQIVDLLLASEDTTGRTWLLLESPVEVVLEPSVYDKDRIDNPLKFSKQPDENYSNQWKCFCCWFMDDLQINSKLLPLFVGFLWPEVSCNCWFFCFLNLQWICEKLHLSGKIRLGYLPHEYV